MKKKLSIKDIASQLGISPTAVSFILNGKAREKRISAEVVKKVEKFIEKTGYKPNSLARSLRTGRTHIIGLMVENISNPFFANIARLIEERAYKNGYKIIYGSTDNSSSKTIDLIQMYRDRHVDGYIIAPPEGIEEELKSLISSGVPVVLFDRLLSQVTADYVLVNNEQSTYEATRHLLAQGCKQIAFITLNSLQSQMQDRLNGYERALGEKGLPVHIKELAYTAEKEELVRYIKAFIERTKNLDAILFGTNYIGVSGLKAIRQMGLRVPEDLSLISFDDHDVFQLNSPEITAIAQPMELIAEKLITLLLEKLNNRDQQKAPRTHILNAELQIRGSVRKAKKS